MCDEDFCHVRCCPGQRLKYLIERYTKDILDPWEMWAWTGPDWVDVGSLMYTVAGLNP